MFHERDLTVAVSELRAPDDQPPVAVRQALQTGYVTLPDLIVNQLLVLGCRTVGQRNRCIGHDHVQTTLGAPQLVIDPVLDSTQQVSPERSGVLGLERLEPCKGLVQRVVDYVAGVDAVTRPRRQAAP